MLGTPPPSQDRHERTSGRPGRSFHGSLVLIVLGVAIWRSVVSLIALLSQGDELRGLFGPLVTWFVILLVIGLAASLVTGGRSARHWLKATTGSAFTPSLRFALYCVTVCWVLIVAFLDPFDPRMAEAAFAIALGVFALSPVTGLLRLPWISKRAVVGIDIGLFNICLLLVGAEIGLRSIAALRPSVLFMRPAAGVEERLEQSRYPPGTVRHGYPVNATGHYDTEFTPRRPGDRLVVSIGDSFSAGVVHHYHHFTTVAERRLPGVTVFNMGLPSIDIPEYHHLLVTEALPYDPDVVVINLFLGNDLFGPLPARWQDLPLVSRWCDRENVLLWQVPRRVASLRRHRLEIQDGEATGEATDAPVLRNPGEIVESFPWIADPMLEKPKMSRRRFLRVEGRRYNLLSQQSRDLYERRLEQLLTMRQQVAPRPLLVMMIPDEFQVNDELWEEIKGTASTRDRFRSATITETWLDENGFDHLNLLPVLRAQPALEDGRRHLYHLRDTHFNAGGNRVVGEALAEFVKPYLGLP